MKPRLSTILAALLCFASVAQAAVTLQHKGHHGITILNLPHPTGPGDATQVSTMIRHEVCNTDLGRGGWAATYITPLQTITNTEVGVVMDYDGSNGALSTTNADYFWRTNGVDDTNLFSLDVDCYWEKPAFSQRFNEMANVIDHPLGGKVEVWIGDTHTLAPGSSPGELAEISRSGTWESTVNECGSLACTPSDGTSFTRIAKSEMALVADASPSGSTYVVKLQAAIYAEDTLCLGYEWTSPFGSEVSPQGIKLGRTGVTLDSDGFAIFQIQSGETVDVTPQTQWTWPWVRYTLAIVGTPTSYTTPSSGNAFYAPDIRSGTITTTGGTISGSLTVGVTATVSGSIIKNNSEILDEGWVGAVPGGRLLWVTAGQGYAAGIGNTNTGDHSNGLLVTAKGSTANSRILTLNNGLVDVFRVGTGGGATLTGNLSAGGNISAAAGTFSGAVTAPSATITGTVTAGAVNSSGTIWGSVIGGSTGAVTGSFAAGSVAAATGGYVAGPVGVFPTVYLNNTTSGPSITSGSGTPSSSAANGSLYLRTDGTGPNLYVRENGSWVEK